MSLLDFVKSLVSDNQRQSLRRLRYLLLFPFRRFRSYTAERRLAPLPDGRRWRSDLPLGLNYSIQDGSIAYRYRDVTMIKHPVEVALYMRLVWETKPRTIVEIGSNAGGSALWLADLLRVFGIDGRVVSIDIERPKQPPKAENLTFLNGDANDLGRVLAPDLLSTFQRPILVIEDASHQYAHTLAVLRFFEPLMQKGEYIIVEDSNVTAMGDDARFNGGPAKAITEFLQSSSDRFAIDPSYCDQFGYNVTGNPNGYLRCIR